MKFTESIPSLSFPEWIKFGEETERLKPLIASAKLLGQDALELSRDNFPILSKFDETSDSKIRLPLELANYAAMQVPRIVAALGSLDPSDGITRNTHHAPRLLANFYEALKAAVTSTVGYDPTRSAPSREATSSPVNEPTTLGRVSSDLDKLAEQLRHVMTAINKARGENPRTATHSDSREVDEFGSLLFFAAAETIQRLEDVCKELATSADLEYGVLPDARKTVLKVEGAIGAIDELGDSVNALKAKAMRNTRRDEVRAIGESLMPALRQMREFLGMDNPAEAMLEGIRGLVATLSPQITVVTAAQVPSSATSHTPRKGTAELEPRS